MARKPLKTRPWYNYAVALCIAVVLYVILAHIVGIWAGFKTFLGFFSPLFLGCVIAYIVNPLAKLFYNKVLRFVKKEKTQNILSITLAYVVVLLIIGLGMFLAIPQLVEGITTFVGNLDGYVESLGKMLEQWGLSFSVLNMENLVDSSQNLLDTISKYISENIGNILTRSANAGKTFMVWLMAFILSIYLLADKDRLRGGIRRFLKAAIKVERYDGVDRFLSKCNAILNRYVIFNLIDALIVGCVNAIFMIIAGLPYVGLVSFIVAITNLVPTFGPIVGAIFGGFVLLLVRPWYALVFVIFTIILQICDGYILKPKLFGETLGVSGLWILVAIIVGGRMFGVVGILIAIPAMAIIDLCYKEYFLPWLEARREVRKRKKMASYAEDSSYPRKTEEKTMPDADD